MTIRVLVNGANGKMGQLTVKTLGEHADFTLVSTTGRNDDLATAIKESQAQVVVDLTNADAVLKNAEIIIASGAHPVIGTSGLIKSQVERLQQQCAKLKLGGIIVPNFSLGAVLIMKQAQEIAKYFPDIEIIEMHHNAKLDSPSGTAMRAAELLAGSRTSPPKPLQNSRETLTGSRGAHYENIPIHAVRLPGLVANLQIMFGGLGETLTLTHNSIDRLCYMPGVVLACKKVVELKELVCGLEHVL